MVFSRLFLATVEKRYILLILFTCGPCSGSTILILKVAVCLDNGHCLLYCLPGLGNHCYCSSFCTILFCLTYVDTLCGKGDLVTWLLNGFCNMQWHLLLTNVLGKKVRLALLFSRIILRRPGVPNDRCTFFVVLYFPCLSSTCLGFFWLRVRIQTTWAFLS